MDTKLRYRPELDGLRAVAVSAVVLFHVSNSYLPAGFLGVNIFFTLSGFLITLVLVREWSETGRIVRRNFYMRRLLRLGPALLAGVALAAPIYWYLDLAWGLDGLVALTYTSNLYYSFFADGATPLGHMWSLAVEEQFYLVWAPMLAYLLKAQAATRRQLVATTIICLAVLAILVRVLIAATYGTGTAYRLPVTPADGLLIGALLATAVTDARLSKAVARFVENKAAGLVGLAVLFIAMVLGRGTLWAGWYLLGFTFIALATSLVIASVYLNPTSAAGRLLGFTPMVWLGQRSYGVYVYHLPIAYLATDLVSQTAVAGLVTVTVTLVISALSYALLERPVLRLKKRFEPNTAAVPASASSVTVGQ